MKKTKTPSKLRLTKESIAALTTAQLTSAGGARPPFFPPSWFECGFTIWCD
jgi:hypothetical protein